jgi:hypothetical protein
VAQITGGGPARVWSEPETGGEAYIPLGESKRGRSLDILGTVADRFGYQLIRANAMRFADGGIAAPSSVAGGFGDMQVVMPRELVVRDADGTLIGRMQVEAGQAVATLQRAQAGGRRYG